MNKSHAMENDEMTYAVALKLAGQGAVVVVNYNGSKERAEEVVKTILENGGTASAYQCSVSDFEACEKMNTGERYITLSGKQKRKFFLIEVRNSFDGEIKFDSNTNLPVSDKEKDISLHGIGLSNVKREVEKYMGDLDIKVKKNEFSVTILLQERRTENEY